MRKVMSMSSKTVITKASSLIRGFHSGAPFALALGAVFCVAAPAAEAAVIAVPNYSFEDDAAGDGSISHVGAPSGWVWTRSGSGAWGTGYDPRNGQFAGTTGDNTQGTLPDGGQVFMAIINGDEPSVNAFLTLTSASSLTTAAANTTYTLKVAVGNRLDTVADEYEVAILLDGTSVASATLDGKTIAAGGFQDLVTSYTTSAGDAGKSVTVQLTQRDTDNTFDDIGIFDNVRLTSVIPEPSTVGLMGLGTAVMLVRRRGS